MNQTEKVKQQFIYKTVHQSVNDIIFFPPTKTKRESAPLLLLIPGGGWQRNQSISMYHMAKPTADILREQGFAVATISYRGVEADGVYMDDIVADVFDAIGYLAKHSQQLRIDPHRIYTMGHSAGAHLALMAGYDRNQTSPSKAQREYQGVSFTVRGVAAIAPPTFFPFHNSQLYTPIDITSFFQEQSREVYRRFSPLQLVNAHSPATYIAAGDRDTVISPVQADLLYNKLIQNGVKTQFTISHGGDHCCMPATNETAATPDLNGILAEAAHFILSCEAESN